MRTCCVANPGSVCSAITESSVAERNTKSSGMSGCMRYTATNSSVSEYGTSCRLVGEPGMPHINALRVPRRRNSATRSPNRPNQLACMAYTVVG
ncbi:Uncharacterised protein [Mycobacteroides abscessus subsp. abscessus]|nr:Uncharacterised protein [Mycobacteroides abscessus subsp. abscessus]